MANGETLASPMAEWNTDEHFILRSQSATFRHSEEGHHS